MPTVKPRTRIKRTDDIKAVVSKQDLIEYGVYTPALPTTLPLEGREDIRETIKSGKFHHANSKTLWVYFYPKPSRDISRYWRNAEHCSLIFGLYHKECILNGSFIMSTSLANLFVHTANNPYEHIDFLEMLTACNPYIVLQDFMGDNDDRKRFGDSGVLTVFENFMLRTWHEENIGLLTMGYVEPEKLQAGWGPRMRQHIAGQYTTKYCIEAPE